MKKDKTTNIIFYGIGGQGVLKAAEVCAWAAHFEGYHVKKTEVHGMAQRGGSVESHIRFGKEVFSPMAPYKQIDYLVCLHPEEHERLKDMLKPGGVDLIHYTKEALNFLADKKIYINTFVLGVLSRYLPLKETSWIKALELIFSKKYFSENKEIFLQGRNRRVL
jgi:indolepyruvate ferredoxin oxidoreductase, beta subunit